MHSINKNFHTANKIIHNVNFLTLHSPKHYKISFDSRSQLKNLGCKFFLFLWIYVATNNKLEPFTVALVVLCVFLTNHTIFTQPQDIVMKRHHLLQFILSNQHDKHTRSKLKLKILIIQ